MHAPRTLTWTWLGRTPYEEGLRLQHTLRDRVLSGRSDGLLLLLEHPPVITLGRHAREANIVARPNALARAGVAVHRVERGGDVTYHGPGQLVGYPVMRVPRGVRAFVKGMADAAAEVLSGYGIDASWQEDRPGLWTRSGKIAAVGLHVTRGVAIHGIAINVAPDLRHFGLIVPCGLASSRVTSIQEIAGAAPPLGEVASRFAQAFAPFPVRQRVQVPPEEVLSKVLDQDGPNRPGRA